MHITAIRRTSGDRYTVTLSDGTEIRSTLGVVTQLRLAPGRALDGDALEGLRQLSARSLARDRALELLSRQRMSRRELETKLRQKGESEDAAGYAVEWLAEHGFLNDADYAGAVARHYAAKGYGAGRVRAELQRRGVPRELWEEAFEQMPQPEDRLDRLISSRLTDPSDREQVRKLSAALFRRGYSWEEIHSALDRFRAETEDLS